MLIDRAPLMSALKTLPPSKRPFSKSHHEDTISVLRSVVGDVVDH